jgi:hypothetical protein
MKAVRILSLEVKILLFSGRNNPKNLRRLASDWISTSAFLYYWWVASSQDWCIVDEAFLPHAQATVMQV